MSEDDNIMCSSRDICINRQLNRFDTKGRTLVLDNVQFIMARPTKIHANHLPEGLYINANDVLKYISANMFGHDKSKFGIDKGKEVVDEEGV